MAWEFLRVGFSKAGIDKWPGKSFITVPSQTTCAV
jgi:hypothetical protein